MTHTVSSDNALENENTLEIICANAAKEQLESGVQREENTTNRKAKFLLYDVNDLINSLGKLIYLLSSSLG